MVKVKKTNDSESYSKSKKKSLNAVHSIKSPQLRRKSLATVLPTPLLTTKNTKANRKSFDSVFKITKINEDETPVIQKKKRGTLKSAELGKVKRDSAFKITKINEDETPVIQKKKRGILKSNDLGKVKQENSEEQTILKDKYNINIEDVESAIKGVIKLHSVNPKLKNQLFDDESFPITVLINCHKIPRGHTTIFRIPLKHSLLTADDEVCLIVSEVKGIGNKEHEKHVEHYEELLSRKGVTNIKKIMTVHELKTEYETFEQKRRLVDLYDAFLVCGKVSGKVVKKCGKIFYKKSKVPTAVKLQCTKLKEHIDKQLSKAFLNLSLKGDCNNLVFGHSKMNVSQVVENFVSVVEFLGKHFPGGFDNIKGLHISSPRTASIPVYISIKNPAEIPKVKVENLQKQFTPKVAKGELTTLPNAEVIVKPSGQVIVKRVKESDDEDEESDDQITLKDIQNDIKNAKRNGHVPNTESQKNENKKKKISDQNGKQIKETKTTEEEMLPEQVKYDKIVKKKKNKNETSNQALPTKLKSKKKIQTSEQDVISDENIMSTNSKQVVKKKKRKHSEQITNEAPAKQLKGNKLVKKVKKTEEKGSKKKLKKNKNSD